MTPFHPFEVGQGRRWSSCPKRDASSCWWLHRCSRCAWWFSTAFSFESHTLRLAGDAGNIIRTTSTKHYRRSTGHHLGTHSCRTFSWITDSSTSSSPISISIRRHAHSCIACAIILDSIYKESYYSCCHRNNCGSRSSINDFYIEPPRWPLQSTLRPYFAKCFHQSLLPLRVGLHTCSCCQAGSWHLRLIYDASGGGVGQKKCTWPTSRPWRPRLLSALNVRA